MPYADRVRGSRIVVRPRRGHAPDLTTWHGRRDRTLLALALQTGLRVSELINLSSRDIVLGPGAHVRCLGKGRKERATPIRKDSVKLLRGWITERGGNESGPLFVSNRNERLSRDAVEQIVRKHVNAAAKVCPSLMRKRVTPHVLRHTAAMQLLQNGVDRTVIALWLGHESVETTQMYIHADIQLKEKAMARTKPVTAPPGRYRPDDKLLAFLEAL
jgi:integrase/recombinase XerD